MGIDTYCPLEAKETSSGSKGDRWVVAPLSAASQENWIPIHRWGGISISLPLLPKQT